MANICTPFACIARFFSALWTSFICLFAFSRRADPDQCDIEAGLPSSANREEVLNTVCGVKQDVETGNGICASNTDDFVDVDLNATTQTMKIFEKAIRGTEYENTTKTTRFDQPSRRPSARMSAVDPVKSRILDTTLKNVQDKAIDVVKPVIITPGTMTVVACTAQIEYYSGTIIEPCSAKIEYFEDHIACSAQVEYLECPVPSHHVEPGATTILRSAEATVGTLKDQQARNHGNKPLDEPAFKPFTLNVEDVDAIKLSALRPGHSELTFKDDYREEQYQTFFTPLPEKKSRRLKEKRTRQRESLFDLISQFPDIPRHTPPGPKISAIALENRAQDNKRLSYTEIVPQSPTISERSSSSAGSADVTYGSGSDDTAQTSVPSSPELVSGSLANLEKDHVDVSNHRNSCSSGGNLSGRPFECPNNVSGKGISPEETSDTPALGLRISCAPCFLDSRTLSHSKESSLTGSKCEPVYRHQYQSGPQEEGDPTEDSAIIESHKAAAYAILSAAQVESDISMDSLLGQLEASSFDSVYGRPDSLVWFMDRTLGHAITPEITSPSATADCSQASVAPLRIIKKKNKVGPSEMLAHAVEANKADLEPAETETDKPVSVEQDDFLLQECARWEESRQAGLKAFREAVIGDDDFYDLYYRDSLRFLQNSLETDIPGDTGDFAATFPSESDSEMVYNNGSPLDGYARSEGSMEEFSSSEDFSNSTGVTLPEEHTTESLSVVFDCKNLDDQDDTSASSDLSFDDDEQFPDWITASDSDIVSVAETSENVDAF